MKNNLGIFTFPACVSTIRSEMKPDDIGSHQNVANTMTCCFTIENFAYYICDGHSWHACILKEGKRRFKRENVEYLHVLALDFDSTPTTPEEVVEYAQSINLLPAFWYYSYSQGRKEGNRFRMVWVLEAPIPVIQYEELCKAMIGVFTYLGVTGIDKGVWNANCLWFGTIYPPSFIRVEPTSLSAMEAIRASARMLKNKDPRRNEKVIIAPDYYDSPPPEKVRIKGTWIEQLQPYCDLLDKWCNGVYITYLQRLLLLTNLKYLDYADNNLYVVKDVLNIYEEHIDTYAGHSCDEIQIRQLMRNRTLRPHPIVEVDGVRMTVPEFFMTERSILNSIEKVSLEELDEQLDRRIPEILSDNRNVYVQCQTACGKTERIIKWLSTQNLIDRKIIISLPRNGLIEEFVQRFRQVTDMPIYPIPQGNYIKRDYFLMSMGFPAESRQNERYAAILRMQNPESKGLFVCTHALLTNLKEINADLIIIDENIEGALIDIISLSLSKLRGVSGFIREKVKRNRYLNFIKSVSEMEIQSKVDIRPLVEYLSHDVDWNDYMKQAIPLEGIGRILWSSTQARLIKKGGHKHLRIVLASELFTRAVKERIPVKLFSATPQSTRISASIACEIHEETFPIAKNKGKIIQYMGISGAKGNDCSKVEKTIAYVKAKLSEEVIASSILLTYDSCADLWGEAGFKLERMNRDIVHLQNCSGTDIFKGRSIIVVGKPDWNQDDYINLFYDMNPPSTPRPGRTNKVVDLNGRRVKMYLWEDETLCKIQLENIRKDLEQAVGRARALREVGATVYVFSNYPVQDADEYYLK